MTLYAFLTALEEDLRNLITLHLASQLAPQEILGVEAFERAQARFILGSQLTADRAALDHLLEYADFGDLCHVLNRHRALLPSKISSWLKTNSATLEALVPIRNRVMHSRPLEPGDLATVVDFSNKLVGTSALGMKELEATMKRLREDPSSVLTLHIPVLADDSQVYHNLPIPDFDESGFIGRQEMLQHLVRAIQGPYPVISIVGEGGVGKTALALKVAYDILQIDPNPFDAIVWTSSKTTQLGAQEILKIEGAIADSIGLMSSVSGELAGGATDNPMADVLDQMRDFRVFLVLDNLETVLDDRVTRFLASLPTGSKVLITSRIGVGAFEYPVKLAPLEESEALQLLRAVAKARGVIGLTQTSNKNLATYCARMRNNPLHIKWFVAAVQAGRRPEEVLADDRLFLDFCMSNVYEFLSVPARRVLGALLCLGGKFTLAELSYVTEMSDADLQRAVQRLSATNMLVISTTPMSTSYETRYELSSLTRAYLKKRHPVAEDDAALFLRHKQQLVSAGERASAEFEADPWSPFNLKLRSRSDWVIAKHLSTAMKLCAAGEFVEAADLIARAKTLAPDYFEVFRVEAWLHASQDNVTDANIAYEAALELEPQSLSLRLLYGGFLMQKMDDVPAALRQFEAARTLDPNAIRVQLELTRALLYSRKFDEAKDVLGKLQDRKDVHDRQRLILDDLRLQYHARLADHLYGRREFAAALDELFEMRQVYGSIQARDFRMRHKLRKAARLISDCGRMLRGTPNGQRATELLDWFVTIAGAPSKADLIIGEHLAGAVESLPTQGHFGFVATDDGTELFFHRSSVLPTSDWGHIALGMRVFFDVGENEEGLCAVNIVIDRGAADSLRELESETRSGFVLRLNPTFGFLRSDSGPEYFFHRQELQPKEAWAHLAIGDRVTFGVDIDTLGRTRAHSVRLEA